MSRGWGFSTIFLPQGSGFCTFFVPEGGNSPCQKIPQEFARGDGQALNWLLKSVQSALSDLKRPPERLQSQCNYRLFIT